MQPQVTIVSHQYPHQPPAYPTHMCTYFCWLCIVMYDCTYSMYIILIPLHVRFVSQAHYFLVVLL